jgi:hypothetical protein
MGRARAVPAAGARSRRLRGDEELAAVAAEAFRPVHGEVRLAEQVLGVDAGRAHRDADAASNADAVAGNGQVAVDGGDDAARHGERRARVGDVGEQDAELVAAEPADDIRRVRGGADQVADLGEQDVTDVVPEGCR